MDYSKMTPNRFGKMMEYKKLYNNIKAEISKGLSIQITTYTNSKIYSKIEQFKLGKNGVYVQRGKSWDCITGASIRSIRY